MKKQTHIGCKAILIAVLFLCTTFTSKAQDIDHKAYTLFIYNFMKYIEWPESQSKGDFVVVVIGDSPIFKELQLFAASKKLNGRTIVIKKCNSVQEACGCHLLFITNSKSSLVKGFTEQTKDKPVLIIGEREGLAKKGAGLSFVITDEDELKFDINKKGIEEHQLKIGSSLIRLGTVIN